MSTAKIEKTLKPNPVGVDLYARFAFAGAMCCAVTHGALTPIDVVKTRIQLSPEIYNRGFLGGFRQVIAGEGAGALLTGFGPTFAGYFLQGAFKFGGYEFWKRTAVDSLGLETVVQNRALVSMGSAALAEFAADIALCPLEATRIRLVSQPTFASGLVPAFSKIVSQEGFAALYAGFGPILFKQIPYTVAKFAVNEKMVATCLGYMGKKKSELAGAEKAAVIYGSGIIAGMAAAFISQPADTLLSKINKSKALPGESTTSRLIKISRELGPAKLMGGLGPRLIMIGTLTAFQFGIYDSIKELTGAKGGTDF